MLALIALAAAVPPELDAYLKKPDASYAAEAKATDIPGRTEIDFTSQTWQGIAWKHRLILQQPKKLAGKGTGILYITGDGPTAGDLSTLTLIAEGTGMPVAMLFGIPNQPLWDMKEDDLIAHTFDKYLETGDASWPLLFPMTKAALRAMDAAVSATAKSENPLKKFVVCGASKRGWTTWFVGAAQDKRVVGIAPMVIDNLNIPAQMKHQLDTWGEYSAQIQDYTRRGLQAKLETPAGQKLGAMVDPYSYRDRINVPTLIIKGSNDPYWTVDALDQYEKGLRMPHWILNVPNAGHTLNGGFTAAESIGAFARSLAGEFKMPKVRWNFIPGEDSLLVHAISNDLAYKTLKIWVAESDNLDFREAKYTAVATLDAPVASSSSGALRVMLPPGKNAAVFAEARYRVGNREFSLSSPTQVFKKKS